MRSMRAIALGVFAGLTVIIAAQVNDAAIRQQVLANGTQDSLFVFGHWTKEGGTETRLALLGEVTTLKGRRFKVLNSTWIWGYSKRATNRILIFSGRDEYLGNYYVSMIDDLPNRIESGHLVFINKLDDHCHVAKELVDLERGLPRRFFVSCRGEFVFE